MDTLSQSPFEARVSALVEAWHSEGALTELLSLGEPALRRVLDAKDGKGTLQRAGAEPRDYEDALHQVILAWGKHALDTVLDEQRRRGWSDERIVLSGLGGVPDPRIVELLLALCASKLPLDRQVAVGYLGAQRDPRATQALIRALRDRSESVRLAALQSLGESGDPTSLDALTAFAARAVGKPWLAREARAAIAKVRKEGRAAQRGSRG